MHHDTWAPIAFGPAVRLIAILCAALCAAGCQKADPQTDAAPQEKPAATALSKADAAAPPAPPEKPDPWLSESTMTPAKLPDAPEIILSTDEDEFAKQVESLQSGGQLAELRGTFGPHGGMDVRMWLYKGRIVKLRREAMFARPAELDLPDPENVREIAVRYQNAWGERVISDRAEILLWWEALATSSVVRSRMVDTNYYVRPDSTVGTWKPLEILNQMSFTSAPSTIVISVQEKPPIVLQVFFEDFLADGWHAPKPGSPVVEKVESYRLEQQDAKDANFQNPLLDVLAEKYYLEITREKGLTNGEWVPAKNDGGV